MCHHNRKISLLILLHFRNTMLITKASQYIDSCMYVYSVSSSLDLYLPGAPQCWIFQSNWLQHRHSLKAQRLEKEHAFIGFLWPCFQKEQYGAVYVLDWPSAYCTSISTGHRFKFQLLYFQLRSLLMASEGSSGRYKSLSSRTHMGDLKKDHNS